jgi:hypothetical protein
VSQDDVKPSKWQDIAARVGSEGDPKKVIDLAKELIRSFDESTQKKKEQVTPESKTNQRGA